MAGMWRLLLCAGWLAGCAPPPQAVEIFVDTVPDGASCAVTQNGVPLSTAEPTPAIALVPNVEADYLVRCRRAGYLDADAPVHARADRGPDMLGDNVHIEGGAWLKLALVPRAPLPPGASMWRPPE